MADHSSGMSDVLLIGGIGVAAYLLWPSISAALTPATAAQPATAPPASSATTGAAAIAENALLAAQAQQVLPTPSSPQGGGTLVPLQSGGPFTPASTTPPVSNTLIPLGPAGQPIAPRAIAPLLPRIGRLRGASSAALIAQAALNQMRTDSGPQVTNNSPVTASTPGATEVAPGCWRYGNTPVLLNCAPNAAPPQPRPPAAGNCLPGYTMDAAGICARASDQYALAQLNQTPYSGPASLPAYVPSPTIIGVYATTVGITPGSVLATIMGLPPNPTIGVIEAGNDGFNYLPVNGVYIRQGTATQATSPTGPIGPRLKGLGWIASTLPISNATLIAASNDPTIAQLVGNDPRAMLTLPQWNFYYSQASGTLQSAPPYPAVDPHALISAQQYQAWRKAAGLGVELAGNAKLGIIRNSRPGMFPLGSISSGPMRQPFVQPGNTNLYRIPGRGLVRLGLIQSGGGDHRWERSPFPRPAEWRMAE